MDASDLIRRRLAQQLSQSETQTPGEKTAIKESQILCQETVCTPLTPAQSLDLQPYPLGSARGASSRNYPVSCEGKRLGNS